MVRSSRCLAPSPLGLFGLLFLCLAALPPPVLAAEQLLFGPTTYTLTAGPSNQFQETIALPPTLTAPFRLHVQNGTPDGHYWILGATITLNGTVVAAPWDFYMLERRFEIHPVAAFDRPVTLRARNTLQVRLLGLPGSFLRLTLYGTIPPPTLTKLEPPTLPITQGGTGTLTATLSAAQGMATPINVQSSNPTVATVASPVAVPANQFSVAIPVTAMAPGTATLTATLNGSSIHSTVTVAPAGPTLTSLLPATLQVSQGAAGMLTVTLSAAQGSDTLVSLTSSNGSLVSLPPGGVVTVPAGQTSQTFAVFGVGQGQATITASLNGSTAESQVTVVVPLPTVVSLLPPVLPLTEGSAGTLTVTLNASQPTDTEVVLATSDATVVGLPGDRATVPAHTLSASFPVTGLTRGTAMVTAALSGSTVTAAITVQPQAPTLQGLTCSAALTVGATSLCTVTLNATQLTETLVPLAGSDAGVLSVPASVPVPANTLTAQFAVTGLAQGSATITAGPLNGTNQSAAIQVLSPPPTLVSLTASSNTLFVGATAMLTLTLNSTQLTDTVIPLANSLTGILSVPATVTVPAGSLSVPVTVTGLTPGSATLTAGPLHGTQAQSSLTVNQLPPTITALTPTSLTLPTGKAGTLTLTIAPTQSDATVVPLTSSDPNVEVPQSVTVPAGADSAVFPVVARSEGSAILTAGPLNQTSQTATVTVTPAELVTLSITPPAPSIHKGQTQPFAARGIYTDATSRDLTAEATWSSSDETVATLNPEGSATGLREGQATITATVGTLSATASLTVTPPSLASVALSPEAPSRSVGHMLQFTATGTLTDGTSQNVTAGVTWTSSAEPIATIAPTGLATALAPGSTTITATHPEGFTASTIFTVLLPPPTLTSLAPASLSLAKGRTATFTVTITLAQPVPTVVSIGVSNPALLSVPASVTVPANTLTASFQVTALTQGTATLTAGPLNGTTQQTTVTVTPPELVSLALAPPTASIPKGTQQPFTATGAFTDGSLLDVTGGATWGSSDPTIAAISAGLATGINLGQATITAAVGSVSATASLTVTAPVLVSLGITPANPEVVVGQTLQLTAVSTLTDGTTQDVTSVVTWTSGDLTRATISATGLVTGVAPGTITVTAMHPAGATASTTVTVAPAGPALTSLTPTSLQISQGAAGILTVAISAAQVTDTIVALSSSDPGSVGVPTGGTVTIPAGQGSHAFSVSGLGTGQAAITAALNGSTVQGQVSVTTAAPMVVSLQPPVLALATGSTGTVTLTLNATQASDLEVAMSTDSPWAIGLAGDLVTIPANTTTATFPVTGVSPTLATISAGLNGSAVVAAVWVQSTLSTVQALTCPPAVAVGATGRCSVSLNAIQGADLDLPLAVTDPAVLGAPASVRVPGNTGTATFEVTGLASGAADVTAGPLTETTQRATIAVGPPSPAFAALEPNPVGLAPGATTLLTVTLTAVQPTATVLTISLSPVGVGQAPPRITVPAGELTATLPLTGLAVGTTTLTVGPLQGTQAQVEVTVSAAAPTLLAVVPAQASLIEWWAAPLTVRLSAAQTDPTVVALATDDPWRWFVSAPPTVTIPAGALSAPFPVLGQSQGTATLTLGPLNGSSAQATVTVNALELVHLRIEPVAASIAPDETQQFKTMGTYTDGTIIDETLRDTWRSSDPTVATIVSRGVAKGLKPGTVTITARSEGGQTAPATLTVTGPPLTSLTLTPLTPTRVVGAQVQFQASGTFVDGTTQELTQAVSWTSSNPAVATIAPTGIATPLTPGITTIAATMGGVTASTPLTVTLLRVTGLTLTPVAPTRMAAETVQFQVIGTYSDGTIRDLTAVVAWTSSNPAVATITSPGGLATALALGTTFITAIHPDGPTTSTTLTVALLAPMISGVIPAVGQVGTLVALIGTSLGTTSQVSFNGVPAAFTIQSTTQITTTVPSGATNGPITVTTPGGTVSPPESFAVVPSPTISIASPADGATVSTDRVLVRGTVEAGGAEVGVVVNGILAQVVGKSWVATDVPLLFGQMNLLTATATNLWGSTAAAAVSISVPADATAPLLALTASPVSGIAPLTVSFTLISALPNSIASVTLDFGDGSGPFTGTSLDGIGHAYSSEGIYTATATVTDAAAASSVATVTVSVIPLPELSIKWAGFKAAIARGDIEGTLQTVAIGVRDRYRAALQALGTDLPALAAGLGDLQILSVEAGVAEAVTVRVEDGEHWVHFIYFVPDDDGIWRILGM